MVIPWVHIVMIVGVVSRTIVPWLIMIYQNPTTKFNKKFLVPMVIGIVINILAAPLLFGQLTGATTLTAAYLVGWASSDMTREAIKLLAPKVGLNKIA